MNPGEDAKGPKNSYQDKRRNKEWTLADLYVQSCTPKVSEVGSIKVVSYPRSPVLAGIPVIWDLNRIASRQITHSFLPQDLCGFPGLGVHTFILRSGFLLGDLSFLLGACPRLVFSSLFCRALSREPVCFSSPLKHSPGRLLRYGLWWQIRGLWQIFRWQGTADDMGGILDFLHILWLL